MSVGSWKRNGDRISQKAPLRKIPSVERKRAMYRKSRSKEDSRERRNSNGSSESKERRYEKNHSPDVSRQVEQGAIKKRIRYRQKGMQSKTLDESDDDDVSEPRKPCKPRRLRSQNSSESNKSLPERNQDAKENSPILVDPEVVEKLVVPTKTINFRNFEDAFTSEVQDSPVTVFVKTTRKLFTPIIGSPIPQETLISTSPIIVSQTTLIQQAAITSQEEETPLQQSTITHLPPLPASPTPQRKLPKEISPNIRLMMVRYNQKISDETTAPRSGGSSGSASPVAWRSPVLERRVKAQTEKYQQELQKMSPLLGGRREVQKSASMGLVVSGNKQVTVHGKSDASPEASPKTTRGILKSSSAGVIQNTKKAIDNVSVFNPIPESNEKKDMKLHITISTSESCSNITTLSDVRRIKLRKAKEEFLNSPPPSAPALFSNPMDNVKYPAKNRLSQISVGSESSCNSYDGLLVKSASAGMINIDPDAYKQFDPEIHGDGYVSLPRASKKNKEGLLSNITSKFRKVKMRRHKDANRMVVVPTLCRQSLLVDIHTDGSQEALSEEQNRLSIPTDSRGSSSAETSPSTSRTGSWISKSKIFKTKP